MLHITIKTIVVNCYFRVVKVMHVSHCISNFASVQVDTNMFILGRYYTTSSTGNFVIVNSAAILK